MSMIRRSSETGLPRSGPLSRAYRALRPALLPALRSGHAGRRALWAVMILGLLAFPPSHAFATNHATEHATEHATDHAMLHAQAGSPPRAEMVAEANPASPEAMLDAEYRLGAGDRLRITVFGHEDLSGEFTIDGSGNIALPLLGQFPAARQTVTELQSGLREALDKDYLVDPRVSVEVTNYRPFFILGEVNSAGSYPFIAGITILEAVAIGGGYTRRARTSSATVTRMTPEGRVEIRMPPEAPVFPGDTIYIDRRLF